MTIGGRPVAPMAPMHSVYPPPPPPSALPVQQLAPQLPVLHASSTAGGPNRSLVQPGSHPATVPVVATAPPQMNVGDITASTMSLADLAPRVKSLGFPASSSFVMGTVERCVVVFSGNLSESRYFILILGLCNVPLFHTI